MDIIQKLFSEIKQQYQEDINKEIVFNGSCIRCGKKEHIWIYAHDWEYKGQKYQEITFGSWKLGDKHSIKSWDSSLNKDKNFNRAYKQKTVENHAKIDLDKQRKQQECREKWKPIFDKCPKATSHEYLDYKGVKVFGDVRVDMNNVLLIPAYDINGFTGVQRIYKNPENDKFEKRFSSGIKISGSIFPLKPLKDQKFCYLCEGYATGSSIQECFPDIPVVICFNASNIQAAINTIRGKYPKIKICIAADNDFANEKNVGFMYASKAAKITKDCVFKLPKFSIKNPNWTDFNDLHQFESKDAVIEQLIFSADEFATVQCLGHKDGNYFYISSENQEIIPLGFNSHNKAGFRRLIASQSYWQKNYGIEVDDQIVVHWDAVASDLQGKCHEKGIFQPEKVRGIGVWKDGKHYVINDGEKVINANPESAFNYQKTNLVNYSLTTPNQDAMLDLLQAFKRLMYKNKNDYFYLAAWYVQAQIFTVLPWRFHLWLTGSAGTGKSTILKWVHELSMNNILTSNTTAAGIRQTTRSNACSVIFDEAEADSEKTKQVIELAREMSSSGDYKVLRGTSSGNALNFNTQCVIMFGSIQVYNLNQADRSRIYCIEMESTKDQAQDDYEDILNRFRFFIDRKNEIFSVIYNSIPDILDNIDFCKSLLKSEIKMESRLADQLSVTMACFFIYISTGKMEREQFDYLVKTFNIANSEYAEQNQEKEHESAYDSLMGTILDNYKQLTVAQCIHLINYDGANFDIEKILGNHGLRYYPENKQLFIQSKNSNLIPKLKQYPDLTRILKRDTDLLVKDKDRVLITQLGYVRGIKVKVKS
jgi:phage/plasmid primase-like uncharacterized protein